MFPFPAKRVPCPSKAFTISRFIGIVWRNIEALNSGIEFVPAVATIIFILACINFIFPSAMYRVTGTRFQRRLRRFGRFIAPWILLEVLWIPLNKFFYFVTADVLELDPTARDAWLPFFSVIASLGFMFYSLQYSGYFLFLLNGNRKRSRVNADFCTIFRRMFWFLTRHAAADEGKVVRTRSRTHFRVTRQGTIFGKWTYTI